MTSVPVDWNAIPVDFGPSIAAVDVDLAVINTLRAYLPRYLTHVKNKYDLQYDLPAPKAKNYANVLEDEEWRDGSLPAILVYTAHTAGDLVIAGDGTYSVTWEVAISAVVRGRRKSETRVTASLYELAVRKALVHHRTLGGFGTGLRWIGGGESRPLTDPHGKGRYLGEGASQYHVFTDAAVQEGVGPQTPTQPEGDPIEVTSVETLVEAGLT